MKDNLLIAFKALTFVLLQVLVLNHIQLFGWCGIYLYIIFILTLPNRFKPIISLLIAALYGGCIDIFSGVYGMHTATTVLIAYIRPSVLKLFVSQEQQEKGDPSAKNYNNAFYYYAFTLIFIHHTLLYLLEAFTLNGIGITMLKALSSVGITLLALILSQSIKNSRKES
ncbi:MAG: hypothetical protein Q4D14_04515 [Bacteroidales bacterium]|nr:hypothetical protein [Bacteroidales bacterium]